MVNNEQRIISHTYMFTLIHLSANGPLTIYNKLCIKVVTPRPCYNGRATNRSCSESPHSRAHTHTHSLSLSLYHYPILPHRHPGFSPSSSFDRYKLITNPIAYKAYYVICHVTLELFPVEVIKYSEAKITLLGGRLGNKLAVD